MTKKCHAKECCAKGAKGAELNVGAAVKSGRGLPQSKTLARVWMANGGYCDRKRVLNYVFPGTKCRLVSLRAKGRLDEKFF
jgi:hypothetical protein